MVRNMSSKTDKRYGLFGGSFDPVHIGHLIIAANAIEQLELDYIYVVPAYIQPQKVGNNVADFDTRFNWLKRVFKKLEKVLVSPYEREKGGLSYSLLTVKHYIDKEGTIPYFIIGEDSFFNFSSWYRSDDLMKSIIPVVYPRVLKENSSRNKVTETPVIYLDAPVIDISSSVIKERVKSGKSIFGMVPDEILSEVIAYYKKN